MPHGASTRSWGLVRLCQDRAGANHQRPPLCFRPALSTPLLSVAGTWAWGTGHSHLDCAVARDQRLILCFCAALCASMWHVACTRAWTPVRGWYMGVGYWALSPGLCRGQGPTAHFVLLCSTVCLHASCGLHKGVDTCARHVTAECQCPDHLPLLQPTARYGK